MSAAAGLAPGQYRALGITLGALYGFFAIRGFLIQFQLRPTVSLGPVLVAALATIPGLLALPAFVASRIDLGRAALATVALVYPVAMLLWPLVAVRDESARLDFWIH